MGLYKVYVVDERKGKRNKKVLPQILCKAHTSEENRDDNMWLRSPD